MAEGPVLIGQGSEGTSSDWEADVLPLNYTRLVSFPTVYSDDSTVTNNPVEKSAVDEKGLQTDYTKQFPDFIVARPTPVASRANIPADSLFPEGAASEGLSGGHEMRFRPISRPENRH